MGGKSNAADFIRVVGKIISHAPPGMSILKILGFPMDLMNPGIIQNGWLKQACHHPALS